MIKRYNFSDFSIQEICNFVGKYAYTFESEFNIKLITGQVSGGRRMGLSGVRSDNDFDLFFETNSLSQDEEPPRKIKRILNINQNEIEVEFNFVIFSTLLEAAKEKFNSDTKNYPTVFYRSDEEKALYDKNTIKHRGERSEYLYTKFHYFIFNNHYIVFNKEYINIISEMSKYEKLVDALDYYYVRAYGNYNNYLTQDEKILVRRYLNCIWQVMSCKWLLEKKSIPPLDFLELKKAIITDSTLDEQINLLFRVNKETDADKSEIFTKPNSVINAYIYNELLYQKKAIELTDTTILMSKVIDLTHNNQFFL